MISLKDIFIIDTFSLIEPGTYYFFNKNLQEFNIRKVFKYD